MRFLNLTIVAVLAALLAASAVTAEYDSLYGSHNNHRSYDYDVLPQGDDAWGDVQDDVEEEPSGWYHDAANYGRGLYRTATKYGHEAYDTAMGLPRRALELPRDARERAMQYVPTEAIEDRWARVRGLPAAAREFGKRVLAAPGKLRRAIGSAVSRTRKQAFNAMPRVMRFGKDKYDLTPKPKRNHKRSAESRRAARERAAERAAVEQRALEAAERRAMEAEWHVVGAPKRNVRRDEREVPAYVEEEPLAEKEEEDLMDEDLFDEDEDEEAVSPFTPFPYEERMPDVKANNRRHYIAGKKSARKQIAKDRKHAAHVVTSAKGKHQHSHGKRAKHAPKHAKSAGKGKGKNKGGKKSRAIYA